jgi:guanine deaminase
VLAQPCPMCLGSLYYCSPREVVFLTTRDAYEPYYLDNRKYFEMSTFYREFAKSWDQRRLPMRHDERPEIGAAAIAVYRDWNARNGGQRTSTVVPSS